MHDSQKSFRRRSTNNNAGASVGGRGRGLGGVFVDWIHSIASGGGGGGKGGSKRISGTGLGSPNGVRLISVKGSGTAELVAEVEGLPRVLSGKEVKLLHSRRSRCSAYGLEGEGANAAAAAEERAMAGTTAPAAGFGALSESSSHPAVETSGPAATPLPALTDATLASSGGIQPSSPTAGGSGVVSRGGFGDSRASTGGGGRSGGTDWTSLAPGLKGQTVVAEPAVLRIDPPMPLQPLPPLLPSPSARSPSSEGALRGLSAVGTASPRLGRRRSLIAGTILAGGGFSGTSEVNGGPGGFGAGVDEGAGPQLDAAGCLQDGGSGSPLGGSRGLQASGRSRAWAALEQQQHLIQIQAAHQMQDEGALPGSIR